MPESDCGQAGSDHVDVARWHTVRQRDQRGHRYDVSSEEDTDERSGLRLGKSPLRDIAGEQRWQAESSDLDKELRHDDGPQKAPRSYISFAVVIGHVARAGRSKSSATSGGRSIDTWGDAGLKGEWATKPFSLYGRNNISGTYEFFREVPLYGGEYKADVKQQPGSEAVVQLEDLRMS